MRLALALVCALGMAATGFAAPKGNHPKLDGKLNVRAAGGHGTSRVIVTVEPGRDASVDITKLGGKLGKRLGLVNGRAAELPNAMLRRLADSPAVVSIHWDRPTGASNSITAVTTGSRAAQWLLGGTGRGVGVAVIDSGVTGWHDDLGYYGTDPRVRTVNGQRVVGFVDFVNGLSTPYDDFGHGTHVAGIIAGNGKDSLGARAGMAPGAHLVVLKVLDGNGTGVISDVIAALGYAVANKVTQNIRVINLSVGAAVTESYNTDPLAQAAKKAVNAGIVVVAAAGNLGKNRLGQPQWGAITAPANAPWVLTVGATNTNGTVWRYDDALADYSSRGPTAIDFAAKPDLVAPGTGIVSLSDPNSKMYVTNAAFLMVGSIAAAYKPYLSLSGTSMAAPVVSGTIAQMLEENPNLTPNLVKAILQYTAESRGLNPLAQGAGFLNSYGAVRLAKFFATARPGDRYATPASWSHTIIWGNHKVTSGVIKPRANAWKTGVTWGASAECDLADPNCENIVWGTVCDPNSDPGCENIVWGTNDSCDPALDPICQNIVWGTGATCDPALDPVCQNIVWGTSQACNPNIDSACENIVWGTMAGDENVVWGTQCGSADCENIVWGTAAGTCDLTIDPACENIVWGTSAVCDPAIDQGCENIVWGTSTACDPLLDPACENIVWGTANACDPAIDPTCENIVWGTSDATVETPLFEDPNATPVNHDVTVFETLLEPPVSVPAVTGGGL